MTHYIEIWQIFQQLEYYPKPKPGRELLRQGSIIFRRLVPLRCSYTRNANRQ